MKLILFLFLIPSLCFGAGLVNGTLSGGGGSGGASGGGTWITVTNDITLGTVYTNTSGSNLTVNVTCQATLTTGSPSQAALEIDNNNDGTFETIIYSGGTLSVGAGALQWELTGNILPGGVYKVVQASGTVAIITGSSLRVYSSTNGVGGGGGSASTPNAITNVPTASVAWVDLAYAATPSINDASRPYPDIDAADAALLAAGQTNSVIRVGVGSFNVTNIIYNTVNGQGSGNTHIYGYCTTGGLQVAQFTIPVGYSRTYSGFSIDCQMPNAITNQASIGESWTAIGGAGPETNYFSDIYSGVNWTNTSIDVLYFSGNSPHPVVDNCDLEGCWDTIAAPSASAGSLLIIKNGTKLYSTGGATYSSGQGNCLNWTGNIFSQGNRYYAGGSSNSLILSTSGGKITSFENDYFSNNPTTGTNQWFNVSPNGGGLMTLKNCDLPFNALTYSTTPLAKWRATVWYPYPTQSSYTNVTLVAATSQAIILPQPFADTNYTVTVTADSAAVPAVYCTPTTSSNFVATFTSLTYTGPLRYTATWAPAR